MKNIIFMAVLVLASPPANTVVKYVTSGGVRGASSVVDDGATWSLGGGKASFDVATGNLTRINNVTTSFPSSNSAGCLRNDGAGAYAISTRMFLQFGNNSISGTNVTRWLTPGSSDAVAGLSILQTTVPFSGTLSKLYLHSQDVALPNGSPVVYTVQINGVNSALTVSMASTATVASDLTHSASVNAGDLVSIVVTKTLSIGASPVGVYATVGLL